MQKVGDKMLLTGAALLDAIEKTGALAIAHRADIHDFLYSLGLCGQVHAAVVLLKISTAAQRWQFTFTSEDLRALVEAREIGTPLVGLVCNRDGVCCLSEMELRDVFAEVGPEETPFVIVTRPAGGSYRVKGREGARLDRTVPRTDWPGKLRTAIDTRDSDV